ncbi:MAG TPA: hypothetical protein VHF07_05325 [Nitrospiraceae bacterium]|nr:hypothetical protein [Nitrospiraceae bacterium]
MMATSGASWRAWFAGLLLLAGIPLILEVMLDGYVLASAYQSKPVHDRPYVDAGRSADLMDESQEQDDSAAGPESETGPPLRNLSGLRWFYPPVSGQLQLIPSPFRPPRLFQ